jgi:general secretion pathway protein H
MTSRSEVAAGPQSGFTLIEIIVVLTIVGLMMVLIANGQVHVSPAVHARAAAQSVSAALREARSEAVMLDRSVFVTIDVVGRSYQVGTSPRQALSEDLRLSLDTADDRLTPSGTGRIRFDPDGSSSGGRVSIEGGNRTWLVGVDWLSGRVSIEEPHR